MLFKGVKRSGALQDAFLNQADIPFFGRAPCPCYLWPRETHAATTLRLQRRWFCLVEMLLWQVCEAFEERVSGSQLPGPPKCQQQFTQWTLYCLYSLFLDIGSVPWALWRSRYAQDGNRGCSFGRLLDTICHWLQLTFITIMLVGSHCKAVVGNLQQHGVVRWSDA